MINEIKTYQENGIPTAKPLPEVIIDEPKITPEDTTPEKEKTVFTKEQMTNIIQDVIDAKYEIFDIDKMANYSADFNENEPYLINIWSVQAGFGFGYIVLHDFLKRVEINNTFLSTDTTDNGKKLMKKAEDVGLIEKIESNLGLARLTRWKLIGNPDDNLKEIKKSWQEDSW